MKGKRLWDGERIILLNQFVRFFLALRYQKSRVFPCKLPPLISLSDVLHCTTTHQRPEREVSKRFKAQMGAAPVYPWAPWITSFTLMSNRRQEEEEHKSKDLHRLRNLRRFMPSPATPTLRVSLISFFLFIFSPPVFHTTFCLFFCLCTFLSCSPCTCTPRHLPPPAPSSLHTH